MISSEPAPQTMRAGSSPCTSAMAARRRGVVGVGIEVEAPRRPRKASIAPGEGPKGFSFELSFRTRAWPSSSRLAALVERDVEDAGLRADRRVGLGHGGGLGRSVRVSSLRRGEVKSLPGRRLAGGRSGTGIVPRRALIASSESVKQRS